MEFAYDARTTELIGQVNDFMDSHVYPAEETFHRQLAELENRWAWDSAPVLHELRAEARGRGFWNFFLPGENGAGLTNLQYAPLAEISGRSLHLAPAVFNCAAPDTGNMEVLNEFGTAAQKDQWLTPLLNGEIRSAFAMTEPDVASSDATNITTSIRREGDEYVIDGRKWFITNAAHPNCRILIVMGKTDPDAERHRQQTMVLVPMDTPGVEIVRNITTVNHHAPEGHCEILFRGVRVPVSNRLGEEGSGFALAQARLGPGRIHHCMRSIGAAEVALELMTERAQERKTFGRYLHQHGTVAEWIARSRIEIDQARLLVLKTAWMIDRVGAKAARKEISMIKALVPVVHTTVCDRAMQVFGAMGISPDTPLADSWTWGRALRFADGPDEVHLQSIARMEIGERKASLGTAARYLTPPTTR